MAEVLNVAARQSHGKHRNRRLRDQGHVPGILYGHKQEPVSLAVPAADFARALRHGSKLVELKGAVNESAIIREMQWDTFGQEVLHIDFVRVDPNERLTVEIPLETRGIAPGSQENGIVELLLHSIEIETTAQAIPDKLHLNINEVHVGDTLTVADIIDLPPGAKVMLDDSTPLLHCVEAVEEAEVEAGGQGAEPELIGGRAAAEEGDEE